MKNHSTPNDIKEYVKKQTSKLIAKWLIFTLGVGLILFLINMRAKSLGISQIPLFISIILLVAPFFITKAYKLFDKSYIGTIEQIKRTSHIKLEAAGHSYTSNGSHTYIFSLILYIRKENGKIIRVKTFEFSDDKSFEQSRNANSLMEHYKKGDKVIHIAGTKYLQVIDKERPTTVCTICGSLENSDNEKCSLCNHTLKIKKSFIVY